MRSLLAFLKKECTDQLRSGTLLVIGIIFILFGVMNPAVAKLTPWLMELFAETLEGSGINVTTVTVTAMDSWLQFFKNIPMALIAFVLIEGLIFTKEYQSGTLILSLTKGLKRYKVVTSKAAVLIALWTAGYFSCYGITYAYNAYFWDNSVAHHLFFSVVCWWLFGIFVISLIVLFSVICRSSSSVYLGCGAAVLAFYLVGLIPKVGKFMPTALMDGSSLVYGMKQADEYVFALIISLVLTIAAFCASIVLFNKKQL